MNDASLSHAQKVKAFFEAPDGYFRRRAFDIRIRTETIEAFTASKPLDEVLDVGCGDGAVSLPLIRQGRCRRLSLLDISKTMLELARTRAASHELDQIEFINGDFLTFEFGSRKFDLIVCVGVLAHVASPAALIEKLAGVLKPGGSLLVEVTDSHHPVGRALVLYHAVLGWFRPATYRLNRLRMDELVTLCSHHRLQLAASYRYAMPPPGSQRVFSHEALYRTTRALFGDAANNRRAWLGNVAIYRFDLPETKATS